MSRNWLEREGPSWIEKKIITHEQYEELLNLYPSSHQRRMNVLPILGSILLGLSLLTFVASNWEGIPNLARLIILITTMAGFYISGYSLYQKGHIWVGQGLLGLGVISFGANMVLIGQMYHLIAYDARLFVLWSLAGIGLLYLIRRSFFFYLSSVLIIGGQVYAMVSFNQMSWFLFGLSLMGLGLYAYQRKEPFFGWILSFMIGLQSIFLVISKDLAWSWISTIPVALYVLGIWLGDRPLSLGFKAWPTTFSFGFSILMVFFHEHAYRDVDFLPSTVPFVTVFAILLLLGLWKIRRDMVKWTPFILFLPFFYFPYGAVAYLIIMFVYSSFLIYLGDYEEQRWKANLGVLLFLLSSVVGYFQLAWDFLDKSIFFLFGGVLLFTIHWALRRRNRWLTKGEE